MINDWIVRLSGWLIALAAVGFAVTVWATAKAFQASRTGAYYVVREEARRRGLRLIPVAVLILVLGITIGVYARVISQRPPIAITALPSPTPTATAPTPIPTSSPTSTPSSTPTSSPAPLRPTTTATPTHIPPGTLPPALLTPVPSAVPAASNAQLGPITFTVGAKDAKCPSSPAGAGQAEFEVGVPKICAYFPVHNMLRNTTWTAAWYVDGKYDAGDPLLWDGPANGIGIAFYGEPGHRPGRWELRLYIEDRLQGAGIFTVSLPAATPTPTITSTPGS